MVVIILSYNSSKTRKNIPKCDVSFTNGDLHRAYGHVTLTMMSRLPEYGHRSLAGCRLPVSVHTVGLLSYAEIFLELSCFSLAFSICDLGTGPVNDVTVFCLMICYGRLVCFCCQIFPICPCQCSVADGFHFFPALFLSFFITPACFSNVYTITVGTRGSAVERQSLASVLSPSCARPVADG